MWNFLTFDFLFALHYCDKFWILIPVYVAGDDSSLLYFLAYVVTARMVSFACSAPGGDGEAGFCGVVVLLVVFYGCDLNVGVYVW